MPDDYARKSLIESKYRPAGGIPQIDASTLKDVFTRKSDSRRIRSVVFERKTRQDRKGAMGFG